MTGMTDPRADSSIAVYKRGGAVDIKPLAAVEINRIVEVDRSEHITLCYQYQEGQLNPQIIDLQVTRWSSSEVALLAQQWIPILKAGGVMLGALSENSLVGFAILRYQLTETIAQLVALYVSKAYRRKRIAQQLLTKVSQLAANDGAQALYVSAAPFVSAVVGFYSGCH
jgi:GNAT superfamily N-acetyltransferase